MHVPEFPKLVLLRQLLLCAVYVADESGVATGPVAEGTAVAATALWVALFTAPPSAGLTANGCAESSVCV